MRERLLNQWYSEAKPARWLRVLSHVYSLIVAVRKKLYASGLLKRVKFSVPVIVVGNLSVGGTGKTPLVIAIYQYLKSIGLKPGIVSRGYGGKPFKSPVLVNAIDSASDVGDEAIMFANRCDESIVICPDRVLAVQKLITDKQVNIVISDDGLQHYKLQRDIEILVVDGDRLFGNRHLIPAGPLREPLSRLKEIDAVVVNGKNSELGDYAMNLQVDRVSHINQIKDDCSLADFSHQDVYAIAAIGNPQRFFNSLLDCNINAQCTAFDDHHLYTDADLSTYRDRPLLMTEKDAVKCSGKVGDNAWSVNVSAMLTDEFYSWLKQSIGELEAIHDRF